MTFPDPFQDSDIPQYFDLLKKHDQEEWKLLASRYHDGVRQHKVGMLDNLDFTRLKSRVKYALMELLKDVPDPEAANDILAALIQLEAVASACFDPESPKVPALWREAIMDARTAIQSHSTTTT